MQPLYEFAETRTQDVFCKINHRWEHRHLTTDCRFKIIVDTILISPQFSEGFWLQIGFLIENGDIHELVSCLTVLAEPATATTHTVFFLNRWRLESHFEGCPNDQNPSRKFSHLCWQGAAKHNFVGMHAFHTGQTQPQNCCGCFLWKISRWPLQIASHKSLTLRSAKGLPMSGHVSRAHTISAGDVRGKHAMLSLMLASGIWSWLQATLICTAMYCVAVGTTISTPRGYDHFRSELIAFRDNR